jgi:hypothetical protein
VCIAQFAAPGGIFLQRGNHVGMSFSPTRSRLVILYIFPPVLNPWLKRSKNLERRTRSKRWLITRTQKANSASNFLIAKVLPRHDPDRCLSVLISSRPGLFEEEAKLSVYRHSWSPSNEIFLYLTNRIRNRHRNLRACAYD